MLNISAQVVNVPDSIANIGTKASIDSLKISPENESDIKSPISYSAKDSMMFSVKTKMIYAYGESKLSMDEMQLDAGFIKMNMDSDYLYAEAMISANGKIEGYPVFKQGDEEYKIKTIKYNFKSKKGLVTDVVSEQGGGYLHAQTTKMQPNKEIHIANGKFTTCNADHPHFYMELTKAKVIPDKAIVSGPFYFVVSDIPLPIGLPFGYFPNQKNRTSGIILPTFTEEKRRGFGLERGGFYWAASDYADLTIISEIWSSGSWGVDLSSNYKKRYKYSGNFNLSYKEVIESEPDLDDYSKKSSFWVKLNYARDSKANPTTSFNTSINFGSSKFRQYESSNPNDFANNNTSSSIAYTKSWPGTPFNFSANMSATQNLTTHAVSLDMPTIAFNMNKQFPFKRKMSSGQKRWYEQISVGFSSNLKNSLSIGDSLLFTETALKKMSNGMQYKVPVSTSLKVLKYLNFSPGFNYSGRIYTNYLEQRYHDFEILNGDTIADAGYYADTISGLGHVYDFSFSAPLSTKLYGLVQFKKGKIAAFRHVMSPSVSFSYRPDFGDPKWGFYKTDLTDTTGMDLFSTYRNGIYGTAPMGKSGSIGFSLDNNFEMKVHSKDTTEKFRKIVLLQSLRFGTSYNLAADSMNWSDISIGASTKLFKQVNVTYSGNIDLYTVDANGREQNKTYIKEHGVLGNLSRSTVSLSGSINSDTFKNKKEESKKGDNKDEVEDIPDEFEKSEAKGPKSGTNKKPNDEDLKEKSTEEYSFSMPWNLTINYNYSFNHSRFNTKTQKFDATNTQTVNLSAGLSLTSKWKVSGSLNYDLEAKELVHTSWNIHRDLHCWEMSFTFVPFGTYQSYSFRINVRSSLFQGLEYKKTASWRDNVTF